jgi:hypothetical protein
MWTLNYACKAVLRDFTYWRSIFMASRKKRADMLADLSISTADIELGLFIITVVLVGAGLKALGLGSLEDRLTQIKTSLENGRVSTCAR